MPAGMGITVDGSDELLWRGHDPKSLSDVYGRFDTAAERFEPFPVPSGISVERAARWEHGWYLLGHDARHEAVVVHVARETSGLTIPR